jgi:predicted nuclease with TOPRIM domain
MRKNPVGKCDKDDVREALDVWVRDNLPYNDELEVWDYVEKLMEIFSTASVSKADYDEMEKENISLAEERDDLDRRLDDALTEIDWLRVENEKLDERIREMEKGAEP